MMTFEKVERYARWRGGASTNIARKLLEAGLTDTRCFHLALNLGIQSIEGFAEWTEAELLRQPNFARKSLNKVRDVLAAHGLAFKVVDWTDEAIKARQAWMQEQYRRSDELVSPADP